MNKLLKIIVSIFIIFLFFSALYSLSPRILYQLYYLRAVNYIRDEKHLSAVKHLKKAISIQNYDYLVWEKLGKSYYQIAISKPAKESFDFAVKSKHAYQKAIYLNPITAESFYGLALSEARLEQLYPMFDFERKNPYDATPYFNQAIVLRPNSATYHYMFVRYLHRKGKEDELLSAINNLIKVYPPAYGHIADEPFWSSKTKHAVKKGLQVAIDEGANLHQAHSAMSSILEKENNWDGAIEHYELALKYQNLRKHEGHYLHLGRLYLKSQQFKKADKIFLEALSISLEKEKTLTSIFRAYSTANLPKQLNQFYINLSKELLQSNETKIIFARSLTDLKQYNQARQILNELNQEKPSAEIYFWLAKTAQREQDWDRMELAIQKATVLEPENILYHELFSQVLMRLNKLDRAEKEAGLAIQYGDDNSLPELYNKRASIRWQKQDYTGAIDDWSSAVDIKPDAAQYYGRIADAYEKMGERSKSVIYYQKALDLEPNNAQYQKRYDELKEYR